MYATLRWTSNFLQGFSKTLPCLTGHPVPCNELKVHTVLRDPGAKNMAHIFNLHLQPYYVVRMDYFPFNSAQFCFYRLLMRSSGFEFKVSWVIGAYKCSNGLGHSTVCTYNFCQRPNKNSKALWVISNLLITNATYVKLALSPFKCQIIPEAPTHLVFIGSLKNIPLYILIVQFIDD